MVDRNATWQIQVITVSPETHCAAHLLACKDPCQMFVYRHVTVCMAAVEGKPRCPIHCEVGLVPLSGRQDGPSLATRNAALKLVATQVHMVAKTLLLLAVLHSHGVCCEDRKLVVCGIPIGNCQFIPVVVEVHVRICCHTHRVCDLEVKHLIEQTSLMCRAHALLQWDRPCFQPQHHFTFTHSCCCFLVAVFLTETWQILVHEVVHARGILSTTTFAQSLQYSKMQS
mmetsp:Transcript_37537/g.74525  ORF Transcript_37537/g.74525 Transcript_37537/m.74525 type:complete len:227 (+) Transcript_37537:380-1060(+)